MDMSYHFMDKSISFNLTKKIKEKLAPAAGPVNRPQTVVASADSYVTRHQNPSLPAPVCKTALFPTPVVNHDDEDSNSGEDSGDDSHAEDGESEADNADDMDAEDEVDDDILED